MTRLIEYAIFRLRIEFVIVCDSKRRHASSKCHGLDKSMSLITRELAMFRLRIEFVIAHGTECCSELQ